MSNQTIPDLGPLFQMSNLEVAGLSIFLAIIVVVVLAVYVVAFFLKKLNMGYTLLDVVYDAKGFPSLSKFQFLAWTLVILFFFTIVAFIRILGGLLFSPVTIPANLIYLLGISISVVPVASYVSNQKYGESGQNSDQARKLAHARITIDYLRTNLEGKPKVPQPPDYEFWNMRERQEFGSILMEGGVPSLAKFQMFSWTWIAIGIYIITFFRIILEFASGTQNLSSVLLPDIDFALVALMGLSQSAYVAGKWVVPKSPSILELAPNKVKGGTSVIIRGVNFGDAKDILYIENKQVPKSEISLWKETEINFTVSAQLISNVEAGLRELTIVVGGKKAKTEITIEK